MKAGNQDLGHGHVIAFEAFKSENKSKREPNLIIDLFFAENDVYFLRKII